MTASGALDIALGTIVQMPARGVLFPTRPRASSC